MIFTKASNIMYGPAPVMETRSWMLDIGKLREKKAGGCPVLLFSSVNTSGQFVGVAEMVGPVDFNKTVVEYWQQDDKWIDRLLPCRVAHY